VIAPVQAVGGPRRIQRRRRLKWRVPAGATYVGRPSRFGNPIRLGDEVSSVRDPSIRLVVDGAAAVALYRSWLDARLREDPEFLAPLRGRDLVCWCPLEDIAGNRFPCHADFLLELANAER
jgi:hypothetical protein